MEVFKGQDANFIQCIGISFLNAKVLGDGKATQSTKPSPSRALDVSFHTPSVIFIGLGKKWAEIFDDKSNVTKQVIDRMLCVGMD